MSRSEPFVDYGSFKAYNDTYSCVNTVDGGTLESPKATKTQYPAYWKVGVMR